MRQRNSILSVVLGAAVALPVLAAPGRYAISAGQIAAAVTNYGMQVSPDQVNLLAGVVANVAAPELKIKSIDPAGSQRAIARLECVDSEQCLPFIVSIQLAQGGIPASVSAPSHGSLASPSQNRPAAVIIRAGSPAILLLDGAHVHISLAVICLDNGALGQTVRATDKDHRQTYMARVSQDGTLEGRL